MTNDLIATPARSTTTGVSDDRSSTHPPAPTSRPLASRPGRTDRRPASPPGRTALHGTVLTVGALMWAVAIALYGNDPPDPAVGAMVFGIGSGAFQIGLLFLLRVLRRTDALGAGKVARSRAGGGERLRRPAIASTVVDAVGSPTSASPAGWLLDVFWPISMIGMFGLAIRIAIAGRWRGVSRFWPLVAESWAVCVIPTMNIFGQQVAGIVAVVHLLVGYCTLGQIVARKSDDRRPNLGQHRRLDRGGGSGCYGRRTRGPHIVPD